MTGTISREESRLKHKSESSFNWRNCWYPVAFLQDLDKSKPYSFSLYNQPFVIFQDQAGKWGCLADRCSHRAAKLSDGQIIDGSIECLYHGWQFDTDGDCQRIPQLPEKATIPRKACVESYRLVEHQGVAWVWPGEASLADETKIAAEPHLNKPGVVCMDTMSDLPFEQTYVIENFLDPAHVVISHDRTELGAKRENAKPLALEISSISAQGFTGKYTTNLDTNKWGEVEFLAPHIVRYDFGNEVAGVFFGFALYALPLSPHSTRVLVRRYGNIFPKWFTRRPRWLEHLRQNKVLEEDLFFLLAQNQYFEQSSNSIKKTYLPLKTADVFVMEHRKWLDKYGTELPFYQGYATSRKCFSETGFDAVASAKDRLTRHTQLCPTCSRAYRTTERVRQGSIALGIALTAVAIVSDTWLECVTVLGALLSVGIAVVAGQLKRRFEQAYER